MEDFENKDDLTGVARSVLETLLDLMGVAASVAPSTTLLVEDEEETADSINLEITGEDLGILIGRRGLTLSCLQYMVRIIVGHQTQTWLPITIDVEGYKRRRYDVLQALAWRIADQVKTRKMPFALEPMLAYERRVIHLTLADHPDVTTQSSGEGEERKVVILPREQLT